MIGVEGSPGGMAKRSPDTSTKTWRSGVSRFVIGDRRTVAGTVYGTIIVLAVIAAGAKPYEHQLWRLIVLAGVSTIVLWLAHVYSHGLGESLRLERRLKPAELTAIARREYAIVAAAIPPLAAVALGAVGVLQERTSVWIAFGIGVLGLAVQGMRYAKLERLTRAGAALTVTLNLVVGLGLVALEVAIAH
jgi:hypothetical protein